MLRMVLVLGLCLTGCSDDVTKPASSPYARALTHPDSLIHDLMLSYHLREIGPYANLLASDFQFHFLPSDAPDIPNGTWDRAADSTGTGCLFNGPDVVRITIALQWPPPVPDTLRGEPVQRVDVSLVDLKIDIDGGNTTLQVYGDRQIFFFILGRKTLGEDPERLYLFEWEDLGKDGLLATEPTTWSRFKNLLSCP